MLESTCGFIERLESIGLKSPEKNPPADYWGKITKNIYYKKGPSFWYKTKVRSQIARQNM